MKPSSDREAVSLLIDGLNEHGIAITYVLDGEGIKAVSSKEETIAAIFAVDVAHLRITLPTGMTTWVLLVLGNRDPLDLVADYGVALSPYIEPIIDSWL